MKSFFYLMLIVITSVLLTSCQNQTVTTEKVITTVTQLDNPGTDGFILKVKKGDTVWDFSQKVYGTGFRWRDIVSQNPFLNEPGRVEKRGDKWIVWIYPGEEIHIGDKVITASGNGQITETVKTTETTQTPIPIVPWWGWLLIVISIALLVWLFGFYRPRNTVANCSHPIYIDIRNGVGIDMATTAAIITEGRAHNERMLDKMLAHGDLSKITLDCPDFHMKAKYKDGEPVKKEPSEAKGEQQ